MTKAVIGKGKISNNGDIVVNVANSPSKVLGCWIINHYYVSVLENKQIYAKGKYDLHIWYGFNNDSDTMVHRQTIDYVEAFNVKMKSDEQFDEENEFVVKCIKYPTCVNLNLNDDGTISVKVEKELNLDVIGEVKLKVQVTGDGEWLDNDELDNIDVNYLNK